jgi:YD repeat-containing protein
MSTLKVLRLVGGLLLCALWPNAAALSQSLIPQPPERVIVDENNVDVTSGDYSLTRQDLSIGSPEYGLTLASAWSMSGGRDSLSGMLEVSTFGQWNTSKIIKASWGNKAWVFENYSLAARAGDGTYLAPTSPSGSGYTLTMRDGTVVTYSLLTPGYFHCPNDGIPCYWWYFPTKVVYPNGLVVVPHYRVFLGSIMFQLRIQSVTNSAGYQIKFTYASNTISDDSSTHSPWVRRTGATAINNAIEYCDPDADSCSVSASWPSVSYSSSAGVSTVTDALGRTTQYTWGPTYYRVKTPASPADNIQFTIASFVVNDEHVRRVTAATRGSSTWTYSYAMQGGLHPGQITTTSLNPQGKQTVYVAGYGDYAGELYSVKDPLNRTTAFTVCRGTSGGISYRSLGVYSVTSPEGNSVVRTCDPRGNVTSVTRKAKAGANLPDSGATATFAATCTNATSKICNQPTATFDARGAQADFEYDPAHGGVLKGQLPAVNGVRPEKRFTYDQKYAYVKNAAGVLGPAATAVWVPTKVSECRTTNSCTGGADETVTTYEYGAEGTVNRLLLRGKVITAGGVSLRTCYTYDQLGNRTSETTPRAGVSTCP